MNHKPGRLDVITDLKRSISASYSKDKFNDTNVKTFLQKAESNLKEINLSKNTYSQIISRLNKAKDPKQSEEKRREDILIISSLI
jgi:hypothetical protein